MLIDVLRGLLGTLALVGIAWVFSTRRSKVPWKLVAIAIAMQMVFALLMKVDFFYSICDGIASFFVQVLNFTNEGTKFVFGGLVQPGMENTYGIIFAFKILPTLIFFGALTSGLYYLGVLQKIVYGIAWVMRKTMRISGAEALSTAANIFVGQTEAPLLIKPYIAGMTRSELMCVMTGGMATIAGGVFAAFVGMLGGDDPEAQRLFATHLLSASLMSAPAAILFSKMLVPEDEPEKLDRNLNVTDEKNAGNLIESLALGASDGLKLALNVGAMLIAFLAIVAMLNAVLTNSIGDWTGMNEWVVATTDGKFTGFNLEFIFGVLFMPVAWVIGIPWEDALLCGSLLGQKTVMNEFVAYGNLGALPAGAMSLKSEIIMTYALCGFSNFASIAIQIGGIGGMAPNRVGDLAKLGFRALLGGTLACLCTAAVAGMFL